MIEGVNIKQLDVHKDERGRLMEILRSDDDIFVKFGQVYVTTAKPGFIKAWHYHKKQVDNFTCIKGRIKLVLYDNRDGSKTKGRLQEFLISMEDNPIVVQIPQNVYHGFESACDDESTVINVCTEPYDHENPDEYRLPFDTADIDYKWNGTKGG